MYISVMAGRGRREIERQREKDSLQSLSSCSCGGRLESPVLSGWISRQEAQGRADITNEVQSRRLAAYLLAQIKGQSFCSV
jgi:hypothetical protein